ncbi:hypothetical protein HFN89_01620 [Rhizobium laguerreae]|nr:hypothetical protein [Rhizobium laguerreae]
MTDEERKTFDAMCAAFCLTDVQKAEMAKFIEGVSDAASERGEISGASPFDCTWPTAEEN